MKFSIFSYIRSSEDISSGYSTQYSSAEPVSMALSRTSSLTNATRNRQKTKRTEVSLYHLIYTCKTYKNRLNILTAIIAINSRSCNKVLRFNKFMYMFSNTQPHNHENYPQS